MAADLGVENNLMNIAVSITALFSGIFIVVFGNFADRWGSVRTVQLGFVFSILATVVFIRMGNCNPDSFIDFKLFKNMTYTSALLRLSIRTKTPEDRKLVLHQIRSLTQYQTEGYGCTYEIMEGIPGAVLVNSEKETLEAFEIAKAQFGEDGVEYPGTFLGSEDFAFRLQQSPGTYCFYWER